MLAVTVTATTMSRSSTPRDRCAARACQRPALGRQGRLGAADGGRSRPRPRGDRCPRGAARGAAGGRPRRGPRIQRRGGRRPGAPGLAGPARGPPRPAGCRSRGPVQPAAGLGAGLQRARHRHRAGAPGPRRCGRPGPLPQCPRHPEHAAAPRCHARGQRERHGGHRRDPLRRQRLPRRPGGEPHRRRCPAPVDRPGRALRGGPAPESGRSPGRGGGRGRPGARCHGGRGRRPRPRRHGD